MNEKYFSAYQALTDETARRNWERYGNPDGPGAMSFGIALPSWIVDKENSVWVLGLYALVFMIALPTVVGIWWYRSIQYSSDKVSFFKSVVHMAIIFTVLVMQWIMYEKFMCFCSRFCLIRPNSIIIFSINLHICK